jgi:hypothetical protein
MSSTKRSDRFPGRRGATSEKSPASRRGREHWVVRWIGAAKRRSKKPSKIAAADTPGGLIIRLTCADTFLRPARPGLTGMIAQVVPFQGRRDANESARLACRPIKCSIAPCRS